MITDWYTADKAYQAHHVHCATCRAAGGRPGQAQRCSEGQALWDRYIQAGTPPHMQPPARKERPE